MGLVSVTAVPMETTVSVTRRQRLATTTVLTQVTGIFAEETITGNVSVDSASVSNLTGITTFDGVNTVSVVTMSARGITTMKSAPTTVIASVECAIVPRLQEARLRTPKIPSLRVMIVGAPSPLILVLRQTKRRSVQVRPTGSVYAGNVSVHRITLASFVIFAPIVDL